MQSPGLHPPCSFCSSSCLRARTLRIRFLISVTPQNRCACGSKRPARRSEFLRPKFAHECQCGMEAISCNETTIPKPESTLGRGVASQLTTFQTRFALHVQTWVPQFPEAPARISPLVLRSGVHAFAEHAKAHRKNSTCHTSIGNLHV